MGVETGLRASSIKLYHQYPFSDSVKVFSGGFFLSRACSNVIRIVFREKQCWRGECTGTTVAAEERRKGTEVSNLEKVQGLGSFVSFISLSVPFLPHRPAT